MGQFVTISDRAKPRRFDTMPSQAERASVLENDRPVVRAVLIQRNGQRRQGPYRSTVRRLRAEGAWSFV